MSDNILAIVTAGTEKAGEKAQSVADERAVDAEVTRMDMRPDDIPADVWDTIQDNGKLATDRLNEILVSTRFMRLRAGDQAKLIALAQNRAYGSPKQNRVDPKKGGALVDITAKELSRLADRTSLPEYAKVREYDEQPENDDL